MNQASKLTTAVVYGSARQNRQGIKAARFMVNKLEQRGHAVTLIDSQQVQMPFLDLMHKEYEPGQAPEAMQSVADTFTAADGFVIVSAEYNHSIPAALKNLLDHFQKEYLYKPSAIVTYSAGPFGGVRGIINLRAILAELGTPSIPSAFPVSQIHSAFDDDGNAQVEAYDKRVSKFLDEYEWYANALKLSRQREACEREIPGQQQMCRGE